MVRPCKPGITAHVGRDELAQFTTLNHGTDTRWGVGHPQFGIVVFVVFSLLHAQQTYESARPKYNAEVKTGGHPWIHNSKCRS